MAAENSNTEAVLFDVTNQVNQQFSQITIQIPLVNVLITIKLDRGDLA